jgi:hypothetical protein
MASAARGAAPARADERRFEAVVLRVFLSLIAIVQKDRCAKYRPTGIERKDFKLRGAYTDEPNLKPPPAGDA